MPFVKLDADILESTLWALPVERDLFITALLMAKPKTLTEPMQQLNVITGEPTGWVVPPGEYGFIDTAGVGIVRRAFPNDDTAPKRRKVSREEGLAALHVLGEPEADSRTPDFEGRRLVRVAGGFVALNFKRYRDKDHTNAERQARHRDKQKSVTAGNGSNGVTSLRVTEAEAYAEGENQEKERAIGAPQNQDGKRLRLPKAGDIPSWKALAKRFNVDTIPGEECPAFEKRVTEAVRKAGA